MSKDKIPVTPAVRQLRSATISFTPHFYRYETAGGTSHSAVELGVDEHSVIKTLVMEDEQKRPLIVLMHGDCEVSTKKLARLVNAKAIQPCDPKRAQQHSGYLVGGTSPFGTRKKMPIYIEQSVLELGQIYINGGKRGFLVSLASADLQRELKPTVVNVIQA